MRFPQTWSSCIWTADSVEYGPASESEIFVSLILTNTHTILICIGCSAGLFMVTSLFLCLFVYLSLSFCGVSWCKLTGHWCQALEPMTYFPRCLLPHSTRTIRGFSLFSLWYTKQHVRKWRTHTNAHTHMCTPSRQTDTEKQGCLSRHCGKDNRPTGGTSHKVNLWCHACSIMEVLWL